MIKKHLLLTIALLCMVAQGAWAQTEVSTKEALTSAISGGTTVSVKLTDNITLSEKLTISNGKTVTIDLNGKKLSRSLSANENLGMVIYVNGGNLTIDDGSGTNSGSIEGGRSYNGAGVLCESGSTLTVNGGTFKDNDVSRHEGDHGRGGAIFMNPNTTLTITGGVFDGNSAYQGGAIYVQNSASATISGAEFKNCWVTGDAGAIFNKGTLSVTNCTFTGNTSTDGGAIYNETDAELTSTGSTYTSNSVSTHGGGGVTNYGTLTINGGTFTNNSGMGNGGGIWTNQDISMQGLVTIKNNTGNGGSTNNLYLAGESTKINVTGAFTEGTDIHVSLEKYARTVTSGYTTYHGSTAPTTYFTADVEGLTVSYMFSEVYFTTSATSALYVECSWTGGDTDGHLVKTTKLATGVSNYSDTEDLSAGWYVFSGDQEYSKRPRCHGDVNFILKDGCNVEFTKGIHIDKGRTLTIYCQSYGSNMGKLRATGDGGSASNGDAAIGGNNEVVGGNLVIHGGDIYAYPYHNDAAGIGGGDGNSGMQSITIYGGTIESKGRSSGAGIGGGNENGDAPAVTIYGGTITATGGKQGAGIGGGEESGNGTILIYGGTVTATGGQQASGIGSGYKADVNNPVKIYGGTVTATCGSGGAGIGSGCGGNNNSEIRIYGGNVYTTGGKYGAGIGGGTTTSSGVGNAPEFHFDDDEDDNGDVVKATPRRSSNKKYGGNGGNIYIYGGYVEATGGKEASGIGDGSDRTGGSHAYIYGGTVKVKIDTNNGNDSNQYIGSGHYSESSGNVSGGVDNAAPRRTHSYGRVELADNLSVSTGSTKVSASKRGETCMSSPSDDSVILTVTACDHSGCTYSIKNDDQHDINCSYCSDRDAEAHNTDGTNGSCTKCGYKSGAYTLSFYEANATANGYGDATTYTMGNGVTFKLPECNNVPEGMEFVGWKKVTSSESGPTSIEVGSNESLQVAGTSITISADMNGDKYYARYQTCWEGEGTGTSEDPYLVKTKADWDYIATTVNGGYVHYDGKYFKMTDDIGTTDEPVTTMIGAYNSSDKYFAGNFNGGGHKLTVNMSSTSNGLAPFGTVSGGAIRNLVVTGSVSATKNISGLIGCINGDVNVSNCHVNTALTTSGSDDVRSGGITAYARQGNASFTRCLFSGSISGSGTSGWGGFVGWIPSTYGAKVNITNCLFKPSSVDVGSGNTFARYNQSSSLTVTNSYYTQTCGTAQGTQGYTVESGNEEMYLYYGEIDRSEEETQSELQLHQYEVYPFDNGLLYNKKFYTGGTTAVTFTPISTTEGQHVSGVSASTGTPTENGDGSYTLTMDNDNVTITATGFSNYESLTLYDASANTATLEANVGQTKNVTISGRTLYKDGNWNTLCLPFDVSAAKISANTNLNGATIMELDTEGWYDSEGKRYTESGEGRHQTSLTNDGTLYLYFQPVTKIEARIPYLIKWDAATPNYFENPTFYSSYIESSTPGTITSEDNKVQFKGTYAPMSWNDEVRSVLFVGADNNLHWPLNGAGLGAFRAYFQLADGQQAREFVLNFGEGGQTGISSLTPDPSPKGEGSDYYTLDGRKLNGKPTAKGVYIYKGKKVVIK